MLLTLETPCKDLHVSYDSTIYVITQADNRLPPIKSIIFAPQCKQTSDTDFYAQSHFPPSVEWCVEMSHLCLALIKFH